MRISLLGPGEIEKITKFANISEREVRKLILDLGRWIAERGHEIVLIPNKGVPLDVAKAYKSSGGKKVWGIVPTRDKKFRIKHITPYLTFVDEIIEVESWHEAASEIAPADNVCIIIGMSAGVMRGFAVLKFYYKFLNSKTKVVWFRNTISSPIQKEIEDEIPVKYVKSVKEIDDYLNAQ